MRERPKSILFFLEGRDVPSSRFRVQEFSKHLDHAGVGYRFLYTRPAKYLYYPRWVRGTVFLYPLAFFLLVLVVLQRIVQILLYSRRYDVIVLQRDLLYRVPSPFLEAFLFYYAGSGRRAVRVVLDVDDAIYLGKGGVEAPAWTKKIAFIAGRCDLVIAGNKFLAEYFSAYTSTFVIPTTINMERYKLCDKASSAALLTIGWTGTRVNFRYLREIKDALLQLQGVVPFRMLIIAEAGSENPLPELCDVTLCPWSRESELSDLAKIDIGIMPLSDSAWARGKCGFKLLQYLALGIPAVCSPVGVNMDIIDHGENGFLAQSAKEWTEALALLLRDGALRKRLAGAGRQAVENGYSTDGWARAWLNAITEGPA